MPFRAAAAAAALIATSLAAPAAAGASAVSPPPPVLRALASTPLGRVAVPDARGLVQSAAAIIDGASLGNSNVLVGLRLRDEAGLAKLIRDVSDPSSPRYQQYLTAAQFRARFSPSQSSVDAVKAFAAANGLKVASVPRNKLWVRLTGTGAAASRAFKAALRAYRGPENQTIIAPSVIPSVPASLAKIVTGIEGLNSSAVIRPNAASSPPAFVNAGPCSSYWGERTADTAPGGPLPYIPCGYTPKQLQSAYGITSTLAAGIDGRGIKVGVIDAFASSTIRDDVNTWSAKHDLPPVDLTDLTGPLPANIPQVPLPIAILDPQGWAGEQTLDIEAVHGMAPGASIVYLGVLTSLNVAFTQAQNDMVDNHRAQIVTNSYGGAQDDSDANTDAVLKQAAAQGIGFYFSSGDQGDETKDPNGPGDREVNTTANNPMATGVGGTSLAVAKDGSYGFETGWGTFTATLSNGAWSPAAPGEYLYAGGGGTSQTYAQPDYQKGIVPPAIGSYFDGKPPEKSQGDDFKPLIPGRAVPDISMNGDPNTGMIVGLTQNFSSAGRQGLQLPGDDVHYSEYRLGGTSLSSPLFAGLMALADQAAGKPHGFVNPALYSAYKADKSIVRDIVDPAKPVAVVRNDYNNNLNASEGTTTKLRSFNQTSTLHTIPGYDDVTGLGSPNGLYFLHAMAPDSKQLPALPAPPPPACKAIKTLTFKLHAPKRAKIVRVTVRLGKDKAKIYRGKSVKSVRVTLPAKRRALQITTFTKKGRLNSTKRYVGPCGVIPKT